MRRPGLIVGLAVGVVAATVLAVLLGETLLTPGQWLQGLTDPASGRPAPSFGWRATSP